LFIFAVLKQRLFQRREIESSFYLFCNFNNNSSSCSFLLVRFQSTDAEPLRQISLWRSVVYAKTPLLIRPTILANGPQV